MKIFIGTDDRFSTGYQVCVRSLVDHDTGDEAPIEPLMLEHLRGLGVYRRPTVRVNGQLWDAVSGAPMSTKFACSRFFVPQLMQIEHRPGWAMFCDGDFFFRADVAELEALADPRFAVMVVKHDHVPSAAFKMTGQPQTAYARKNWSSLILWNCDHAANRQLTPRYLNETPGRDLHAFAWLPDALIGDLPLAWNWLEGISADPGDEIRAVHYTEGTPDLAGHVNAAFAGEWFSTLRRIEQPELV